jgi:hypothetical protein
MTVKELINTLQTLPQEATVSMWCDWSGDVAGVLNKWEVNEVVLADESALEDSNG